MGLESGTYISDLVATNPLAADPKSQGDDHLRLIKTVLQNTFPFTTGAVVAATGVTLNSVQALKTSYKTVVLRGTFGLGAAFSGLLLGTLPVGYRPATLVNVLGWLTDTSLATTRALFIQIGTDGAIIANFYADGTALPTLANGDSIFVAPVTLDLP